MYFCMFGDAVEVEDPVDDLLGVLHLADRLLLGVVGQPLVAPVSHIRAWMKYWLMAVSSAQSTSCRTLRISGSPFTRTSTDALRGILSRAPARRIISRMSDKDPLVPEAVAAGRRRWAEKSGKAFEKAPAWKKDWTTVSGAPVEPLAAPDTQPGFDFERDLGWPGEYPYTRGVQPTRYRGKLWTMRQFAGYGTAKQTNERFHYLLEHGQTGLSTAFHLPTLYGYDSDHEMARGEVGKCGVAIDSLARHGGPLRRDRPRARHDLDDDQLDGADRARDVPRRRREARDALGRRSAARSRTTSSRSTSRRRSTSSRRAPRCG